jgi:hypothetical protein
MRAWHPALGVFLLAGTLAGVVIVFWWLFAARFRGTVANANVIVGTLALTGVLVTAAVSGVGLSLKQSVDRRTLQLSQADQRRQQMETAMQTVRLMTLDSGAAAPRAQVSAALLVLARLGEISLAVDLAAELWPGDHLTSSTAVRIIGDALTGSDLPLQRDAALLLMNNVGRLDVAENQWEWPACLDSWPASLDPEARMAIAVALSKWIEARPPSRPGDFRLGLLRQALDRDPGQEVRKVASALITGLAG